MGVLQLEVAQLTGLDDALPQADSRDQGPVSAALHKHGSGEPHALPGRDARALPTVCTNRPGRRLHAGSEQTSLIETRHKAARSCRHRLQFLEWRHQ